MSGQSTIDFLHRKIKTICFKTGSQFVFYKSKKQLIQVKSKGAFVDIYLRTRRIVTSLKHPVSGYTIVQRENLGVHQIEELIVNPRIHTGKGKHVQV